jgi:hypothetical protein
VVIKEELTENQREHVLRTVIAIMVIKEELMGNQRRHVIRDSNPGNQRHQVRVARWTRGGACSE